MTPETIAALLNLGSAGAVIIVVLAFLRSNEKRDQEWRDFFTALNEGSKNDLTEIINATKKLIESVDCLNDKLTNHDANVAARVRAIQDASKPRPIK